MYNDDRSSVHMAEVTCLDLSSCQSILQTTGGAEARNVNETREE